MSSGLELLVRPQVPPRLWTEFLTEEGPFSCALDGYVIGPSRLNRTLPALNLNHHEELSSREQVPIPDSLFRMATRSTTGQAALAIRMGLFRVFRDSHGSRMRIFVNDCDEDVCLSVYLLRNHHEAEPVLSPMLNRLIYAEDLLDATAGGYPYPGDLRLVREMAWIFDPYRSVRKRGLLASRDPSLFQSVIDSVGDRIRAHLMGRGETRHLDTSYRVLGGGPGWSMIEEIGEYARVGAFTDNIRAYVICTQNPVVPDQWSYTVGRSAPFLPFDVARLLQALDREEGNPTDHWGGSDDIGGSPRTSGSHLPPARVIEIINRTLAEIQP